MRVTNSRRHHHLPELRLAVRMHRLMAAGLGDALRAAHPAFAVMADPAWLAVDIPGGGLEVAVRPAPFTPAARVACVAGLLAERPELGRSALATILAGLARGSGRPRAEVAERWLARYVAVAGAPVLWLHAAHGVALEAHHQNTLVTLDADGWPVGGWYRDGQGWYVAASHADAHRQRVPGFDDGVPAVFDDALVADRLAYYLGVNNLLGIVGALGAQSLGDEQRLLGVLRRALHRLARGHGDGSLAERLADAPALPCKANLLTTVDGRDELVGRVEEQSVYVEIDNPIAGAPA
jgi:siderophore synthetase component